jgi:hypothetical protein
VKEEDKAERKYIGAIVSGDILLTMKDGKSFWTKVLRNIKTDGEFKFLQITTKNMIDGTTKKIQVTPEHGLILLSDQGVKTIDSARNARVGDKIIAMNGDTLDIVSIFNTVLNEKYTLETIEGTVLASDLFVTTICSGEIAGGERLFEETMNNWRLKHNFSGSL